MIKLLIVGDEASDSNVDKKVAFVGAKCFPTVVKWINAMKPDFYLCINSTTQEELRLVEKLYADGFKVVALGNASSARLTHFKIEHAKMQHPSGLNRKINDKKLIDKELKACYNYIRK